MMSIEINDLTSVEQEATNISDLSSNAIDLMCVDSLINIPLIRGEKGERGERGEKRRY